MTAPAIYVMEETPLSEIARAMLRARISGVPVLGSGGRLVGMVSEGDLIRRRSQPGGERRSWWLDVFENAPHDPGLLNYLRDHGLRAKDVMTNAVVSVGPDTPAAEIAELLETHGIKRVPVLRNGALVGIVSRANLLRLLLSVSHNAHRRG